MTEKSIHSDQFYIEGLLQNDSAVIKSIYKNFVPKVKNYIRTNSGDDDNAADVVQEVLVTIYHQAKTKGLQLTCPFEAYFFLLCKRKWLNELKKPSNKGVTINDNIVSTDESAYELVLQSESFDERQSLFDEMFRKLGEKCQEVLKLSFVLKTMEEVARQLNVTYGYVRKKKSLCTGQLTEMIQQSNRYKSLKK
ncbi:MULTISPECIES: RNA polymerase sigma factor [Flavobacterium]|jgi:RNA polymerase sigma factor (sigma-70 family)|uniref:RNA polymerase sigma factor (Sigma-70 family) n=1 Tax=Flavobacterium lindanitolerans TaxID=428988 RepID=A0A497V8X7_9FLAO|nr:MULTISPECIES: sigma-70 family RNA polymerase sigma factor [Flavobacterium]MBU7571291.1 sigma-70 family RNA polymerase sigma factor [Flavobacterium sp.]THD31100.1 MAG: sigma-70 family RNA polymerase sigma factor [Flavobacterium johnsoniae]KQS50034.1 RNA polymerase subunit sigma-24 [Flavobacterium sp. Leaf359]MBC8643284.1 sigma-70 family RNA polymerase sigma factor [Flavobacterium lindanitolerans]MDQ7959589.1 sigma-70 family RNA polymerase sigma factor [Flavobacterium lindanitolerans]